MGSWNAIKLEGPPGMTQDDLKEHADYRDSGARSLRARGARTSPKTHDYTVQGWGHSMSQFKPSDQDDTLEAMGFGLDVQVGDLVLLRMKSGRIGRFEVLDIRYEDNPRDMFWVTIQGVDFLEDQ